MGVTEQQAREQRIRGRVQYALLSAVAVSGTLLVVAMAPNVLQVLDSFTGNKRKLSYRLKSVAARLAEKGYVRFTEHEGKTYLVITEKGKRALEQKLDTPKRRRRWDKRWRMVLFDVPEKRRAVRDSLRYTMQQYGFVRLQDSAWIYPYDCEDIVMLLKARLRVGNAVRYLIVEKIENDLKLKKHFSLR